MRPGMILYREELGLLLFMSDAEIAEAMKLLARRFLFDEEPETEDMRVDTFLQIAIPKQEADDQKYERRIANSSKGGSTTQANNKYHSSDTQVPLDQNSSDTQVPLNKQEQEQEQEHEHEHQHQQEHTQKRARARVFTKPTAEDVKAYCVKQGYHIDPQEFVDFYESKGWMVGKNHMKDWQACVRTWEKNHFGQETSRASESRHDWNYEDLAERAYRKAMGQ